MIIINKSYIEVKGNRTFLKCKIKDTVKNSIQEFYYSTPIEYGTYLVDEVSDPFVYAAILPAVLSCQDIICEGPVSEQLYYNIVNSLIYIVSLVNNKLINNVPQIKLIVKETSNIKFSSFGVGCGCSLGVDSMAAITTHLNSSLLPDYNITHLTYFNVGAHGYKNLEAVRKSYEKDLKKVKDFADSLSLPLVLIESNICLLFENMTFDQSGNFINASTVLAMQKLFKTYLYGSNEPLSTFKFDDSLAGYYESLFFPLSSTPSTQLIIANPDLTRSQKTEMIMNNELVQKNLYVCWKELIVNNNPSSSIVSIIDKKLNCTRCEKCLRTCLTLDIFGVLEKYKEIFDIPYYYSVKDKYIARVISLKNTNAFYSDLVLLMKSKGYKLNNSIRAIIIANKLAIPSIIHKIKKLK